MLENKVTFFFFYQENFEFALSIIIRIIFLQSIVDSVSDAASVNVRRHCGRDPIPMT